MKGITGMEIMWRIIYYLCGTIMGMLITVYGGFG